MATTATRWLEEHPEDLQELTEAIALVDGAQIGIWTELPEDAKRQIADAVREAFEQPYWEEIAATTYDHIMREVEKGLIEGLSIREMADRIKYYLQEDTERYAKIRATRIARTESANGLNAARKIAMEQTLRQLPPDSARPVWLSALSNTTRDSHADLDGVPADENGLWELAGIKVPWPGHWKLPAGERCNCLCTVTLELGLRREEAERLLQEYRQRVEARAGVEPGGMEPLPDDIFPKSLSELEFVKELAGSTRPRLMRDKQGRLWVLKRGMSAEQLQEEFLAEEMYRVMGVPIPPSRLYETPEGPRKLSRFIEGTELRHLSGQGFEKAAERLRQHFTADALMANWDVVGLELDNIIVDKDGVPWHIDVGGSLRFRAQGRRKQVRLEFPVELWTLRDAKVNRQAAKIFGSLGHDKVMDQLEALLKKERELLELIQDGELRHLWSRRFDEAKAALKASRALRADKWKEGYRDLFTRHQVQMGAAGVYDKFPKLLKRSRYGIPYELEDKSGKPWGGLRGRGNVMERFRQYIDSNGGDYEITARWFAAQAGSSQSSRSKALKAFMVAQRDVPHTEYYWHWGARNAVDALANVESEFGRDRVRTTWSAQHALFYNLCQRVDFPNNNRAKGYVVLARAETGMVFDEVLGDAHRGQVSTFLHDAASSFSIFRAHTHFGRYINHFRMPHHRIFGMYFVSPPGRAGTILYTDSENEIVAMAQGLKSVFAGISYRMRREELTVTEKLLNKYLPLD